MAPGENSMPSQSIQTDLRDFVQFASQRVQRGDECSSLEELVKEWRNDTEYAEAVADVSQGIEDDAAGKAQPIEDAFSEVRRKLGISS
jgi:hypothetical protein